MRRSDPTSSQLLGICAVAFTVLLWGLSGVAIKATSVTGIVTAFYRTWFAIPLLWMTMLSPTLRRGLDREWLRASIIGGVLQPVQVLCCSRVVCSAQRAWQRELTENKLPAADQNGERDARP